MVEQQRSPVLATLAALSLAGWLAVYGLLWYIRVSPVTCGGDGLCGVGLAEPAFLFGGTGALLGFAAWLGATVSTVRRHEILSALSIGLLLPVALVNATLVADHAAFSLAFAGCGAAGEKQHSQQTCTTHERYSRPPRTPPARSLGHTRQDGSDHANAPALKMEVCELLKPALSTIVAKTMVVITANGNRPECSQM